MNSAGSQPVQSSSPQAVCVAWTPVGDTIEPRLQRALTRPGLEIQHCEDAFGVLARLARGVRADGPTRILLLVEPKRLTHLVGVLDLLPRYAPGTAIWLFDPSRHPVLRALSIEGAREAAGMSPKVESTPEDRQAGAVAAPVTWSGPFVQGGIERSAPAPATGAPPLRLAGEGPVASSQVEAFARGQGGSVAAPRETGSTESNECKNEKGGRCRANSRVLTDEEIAMLLGEDPPARKG